MSILRRLQNLARDERHGRDIDDELAFHIEMRTEENIRAGMPPDEARRQAARSFGNRTQIAERTRAFDLPRWLDQLLQDLRYSVRALRSGKLTTGVLVLSLALGIGVNTAMFTVVNALLLRTLPVQDPGSLYSVTLGDFISYGWVEGDNVMNLALWKELQNRQRSFTSMFAYSRARLDQSEGGEVRRISGAYVTPEIWPTLGLRPAVGRLTDPSDERPGSAPVVVLGDGFWERAWGRSPAALGQTLRIDGKPFTIVGIAPKNFFGIFVGDRVDAFLPLQAAALLSPPDAAPDNKLRWWLTPVGRLREGVSASQAASELRALSPLAMRATLPDELPANVKPQYLRQRYEVNPAAAGFSDARQALRTPLLVLSALAGLLLLLACANIANLQLSRGLHRAREIGVRIALGASRWRVARQVFLESLLAALAGAALAIAVAPLALRVLLALYSREGAPVDLDVRPDAHVLAFTAVLGVITALLFGLAPALQAARTEPHGSLRSARASARSAGLRQVLLGVQVGLAVVLTVTALLFAGTMANLVTLDPGFRSENVLLAQVDSTRARLTDSERVALFRSLHLGSSTIPRVESATLSYVTPVSGWSFQTLIYIDGPKGTREAHAHYNFVTPEFFDTFGTPVLQGSAPSASQAGGPSIAFVNQTFAQTLAGGQAIGSRIRARDNDIRWGGEVVGIVKDARYRDLRTPVPPTVYIPMRQDATPPPFVTVALRTRGPGAEVTPALRRTIARLNPKLSFTLRTLESQVADTLVQERSIAAVSGAFGLVALLLAAVGIYGIAAYSVLQRRSEIGIRLALGATAGRLLRLLFGSTGTVIAAGIVVGGIAAAASVRFAESLLFGVSSGSAPVYAAAVGSLAVVAALAVAVPALRALRLDPAETLHVE